MIDVIVPKNRLNNIPLADTIDQLHMLETKLRMSIGKPIEVKQLENDEDWDFELIDAGSGKKIFAVF